LLIKTDTQRGLRHYLVRQEGVCGMHAAQPCRAEMPLLDSFYQRHHAQGLELLGVSVDDTHDLAAVLRIMQQFGYPAALASSAKVNGFGPPLTVPTTWIVDADGVVRARLLAANGVTEQSLNDTVLPLLPAPAAGQ
jgi:cytochrome c biogenesis protein CcmG, thiol:disulfide interchange protein DsbE